jgi:signal transduction histidine kinase
MVNGMQAMETVYDSPRRLVVRSVLQSAEVVVSVEDWGTGVELADMNRLFTAFFTTRAGGMGMGLSICRSIIEAHGGRIWASNNEGPGATFQFALPFTAQETP